MKTLKNPSFIARFLLILMTTFQILFFAGCGVGEKVDETSDKIVSALDNAIAQLGNVSADWQEVVERLLDELPAETQSLIKNEITNLMTRGIAAVGVEVRCNADFIKNRVRQGLRNIKARFLGADIPPLEPHFCQVVPGAVDMNLSPNRRNKVEFFGYDFDHTQVRVFMVNGNTRVNVTPFLDQPTHYHMTLNLGGNGVRVNQNSKRFILNWNNRDISTVAIIQKAPEICKTSFRNIDPSPISFIPRHTNGDKDFKGHGPNITCTVDLITTNNHLKAKVFMKARETQSDFTTAEETKTFTLFTVDPGKRIQRIIGSRRATFSYRDTDHAQDKFAGNGPIREFLFEGDDDGNDAGIHTMVKLTFNRIRLELKETGDCVSANVINTLVKDNLISPEILQKIKTEQPQMIIENN